MSTPIKTYLHAIENNLRAGNATEHTHRPALKALLEGLDPTVTATNEPRRIACGAPDFVITRDGFIVGYVEAKDVGVSLAETERGEQLKRYRRALGNLLLTDQLEFRWYVDGELREKVELGRAEGKSVKPVKGGPEALAGLLALFLNHQTEEIATPRELAERMARLTHMIRDVIIEAFHTDNASSLLRGWRDAFARVLIADLNAPEKTPEFADMFAQTLAYGLFTARVMDTTPKSFTRQEAQSLIPKSNPFLRDFFYQISGPQLDDEPFGVFVDDLVNTLAHTDMDRVLAEFGRRTRQEDPVVHFYETFLAAYDPALREKRGVYYTPEPVVSYIVRSVDYLLRTRFNLPGGLADTSKVTVPNRDPGKRVQGKSAMRKTDEAHKVLVLDPATGTGTFLYSVIDHIRAQFMARGDAGLWPGYVRDHLLPRLFGFELLMAPYAVAHFKLSLQLAGRDLPEAQRAQWAYTPEAGERLGIYLTNTLEAPHEMSGLPLFTQWVADESNAANAVKTELPVLVILGNPPYSNFGRLNKGEWIQELLNEYKVGLTEKKINIDDDFIKFVRFGQQRVRETGAGVLAYITNNTYLDGITHRIMRRSLMGDFDEIYLLNLHGSSLRAERAPNGEKDENVFDIRQGVCISLFFRSEKPNNNAKVFYSDLWGEREDKYVALQQHDISDTHWVELHPTEPYYFFVPKDFDLEEEYRGFWSVSDIFSVYQNGIKTDRDSLFFDIDKSDLEKRMQVFYSKEGIESPFKEEFRITDSSSYAITKKRAITSYNATSIRRCLYRPFDINWLYYEPGLTSRPAWTVTRHMLVGDNLALLLTKQQAELGFQHVFCTRLPAECCAVSLKTREITTVFPLSLESVKETPVQNSLFGSGAVANANRTPNLSPTFIAALEAKLALRFNPIQRAAAEDEFGPEDVFHYLYAVLHSPTYRARYAEFLKIDFPRVPLTSDPALFRALATLGRELVALHLLESPQVNQFITRFPVRNSDRVEKGYPKFTRAVGEEAGRVHINPKQYFDGVPQEVWEFHVGGYQVLDKWLKDRRGRQLSYDDLTHYQRVVVALQRTMALMAEIDATIPAWPIE